MGHGALSCVLEEERKYEVDAGFALPDLRRLRARRRPDRASPPVTLRATYYDTADLRLARAGVSLRYRRGDDEPWTVKLPTDAPGRAPRDLPAGRPGDRCRTELVDLVTAYTRGAPLAPVAVLQHGPPGVRAVRPRRPGARSRWSTTR